MSPFVALFLLKEVARHAASIDKPSPDSPPTMFDLQCPFAPLHRDKDSLDAYHKDKSALVKAGRRTDANVTDMLDASVSWKRLGLHLAKTPTRT